MCSRQRPEEGADSEGYIPEEEEHTTAWDKAQREAMDPPMIDLPRANPSMVEEYVRKAMPMATQAQVASQVAEVVMADSLGRAIHASRGADDGHGVIAMPRCTRVNSAGATEPVPYSYEDTEGGYVCDCEAIALHLVEVMKAQQAMQDIKSSHIIVAPPGGHNGRLS